MNQYSPIKIQRIKERTQGKCVYCGLVPRLSQDSIEHLIPRCIGGSDALPNLVLACRQCNNQRKAHPRPTVFAASEEFLSILLGAQGTITLIRRGEIKAGCPIQPILPGRTPRVRRRKQPWKPLAYSLEQIL